MVRERENIQWATVVWMKMPCWGQRRMGRLVRDDRKATVTRYNQGMQNTISEHTTRRTLKQMGSSSRRPHWVPLLSDKNRRQRIQFTQNHQNWPIEDWENVSWSDESRFLLQHSDVGSEFGVKNMKAWIILLCLNGSGWWCNGVGDIFLAHFWSLSTNWILCKHHSLPEYCCWPYPSLYDYSAPMSQSSNHLRLVSWTWQCVHFTQMASTVTRSQSNRAPLGCGGTGDSHRGCAAEKSAATVWWYHVNMDQNLWGMYLVIQLYVQLARYELIQIFYDVLHHI